MRQINNQKGIALVMVLVLAMIALAIVSALLFMMTKETVLTGSEKFYRTAEEASTGGAELVMQYLGNGGLLAIPQSQSGRFLQLPAFMFANSCNCMDPYNFNDNIDRITNAQSDRCDKLCNPTANWPATLDEGTAAGIQISLDPTATKLDGNPSADLSFRLGVAPQTFDVFAKVVDTVQGNSEVSSLVSEGGELASVSVINSNANLVSPPHNPYLYRVEIRAQATNNPRERARISLLYAY